MNIWDKEELINAELKKLQKKMTKQTVYYTESLGPIVAGERARVLGYQHYRLGRVPSDMYMNTSPVVAVGEDGTTFETQNSIYVLRDAVENDEPFIGTIGEPLSKQVEYQPV